ncbi:MAG: anaerobic ribonucleoside-triphosphate reductase, partial [Paraclostridium sp.]
MKVIKRNGTLVEFDKNKITDAIDKAMLSCGIKDQAESVIISIVIRESFLNKHKEEVMVEEIEKVVYEMLVDVGYIQVAKAYEGYRAVQEYKRVTNTIDNSVSQLLNAKNDELRKENSNKDTTILSTGRDYVAGEYSKDYMKRVALPTHIVSAHESGAIHYHDLDFGMQPMINCCLIPIGDMLEHGVVMNKRLYETPNTFEKACGITAQVIAQVTSNQYGGNSVNVKHLAKYLKQSADRIKKEEEEALIDYGGHYNKYVFNKRVIEKVKEVCRAGVRSLLWQINGFATLSGQSPFTTLFLEI